MNDAHTRTYTYDARLITPADRAERSGMEIMQAILAGELPMAAIADTLDFRLAEVEPERVVLTGVPRKPAYNMFGAMHGGWAATLLDSAMGCAVNTIVPRGFHYTTVDLTINYVRAVTEATGEVRVEGKLVHGGRRIATAEGRMMAADGRLLAHGVTTCMIFALSQDD